MDLSLVERQILWNQLEIMKSLQPKDPDYLVKMQKILEHGYTLHYDQVVHLARGGGGTLDESDARFVRDTLDMMDGLFRYHTENGGTVRFLGDTFGGFDGNYETSLMSYARFLIEVDERWTYLGITNFNSHCPMKDKYSRMLSVWKHISMPEAITALTDAQVKAIRDASLL